MKHFKNPIDVCSVHLRSALQGEAVENGDALRKAFSISFFHYQFKSEYPSRIMRCSSESELAWLIGQVEGGASVVIKRA